MNPLKKPCPACSSEISISEMKDHFDCPHCKKPLMSNSLTSLIVSGVVAGVIELFFKKVLVGIVGDNFLFSILHVVGSVLIFVFVYRMILSLEIVPA